MCSCVPPFKIISAISQDSSDGYSKLRRAGGVVLGISVPGTVRPQLILLCCLQLSTCHPETGIPLWSFQWQRDLNAFPLWNFFYRNVTDMLTRERKLAVSFLGSYEFTLQILHFRNLSQDH